MVIWLTCHRAEDLRMVLLLLHNLTQKFIRQIQGWRQLGIKIYLLRTKLRKKWWINNRINSSQCNQRQYSRPHKMIWTDNNGLRQWWHHSTTPWRIQWQTKWLWCQLWWWMAWYPCLECSQPIRKCKIRLMLCRNKSCNYAKWHKCKHKLPSFKTMRKHTTKAIPSRHHLTIRLRWWLQLLQRKIILQKPKMRIKTCKTWTGTHLLDPARNLCKIHPKIDRANKCHQSKTIRATIKGKQRINGQIRHSIKVFKSKLKAIRSMRWCQKFQLKSLDRARLRKRKSYRRKKLLIRKVPPKMREII